MSEQKLLLYQLLNYCCRHSGTTNLSRHWSHLSYSQMNHSTLRLTLLHLTLRLTLLHSTLRLTLLHSTPLQVLLLVRPLRQKTTTVCDKQVQFYILKTMAFIILVNNTRLHLTSQLKMSAANCIIHESNLTRQYRQASESEDKKKRREVKKWLTSHADGFIYTYDRNL